MIHNYDSTNEAASINENGSNPFRVSGDGTSVKFSGMGNENWTLDWSDAAQTEWGKPNEQPDIIFIDKNAKLTIENLGTLNFTTTYDYSTKKKVNTGLKASSGATVAISGVDNVMFGTENQKFNGDQALHAYGGTITLKDVGNLYVNATGGAVLMSQYAEGHDGKLNIEANSVNIKSDSVGACVGAYQTPSSGTTGKAELIVKAKDQVNISTGDAALSVSGSYQGGDDAPTEANVQISGENGVILDGIVGIYDTRNNNTGSTTVNISSADGNVTVSGDKGAIFTKNISGEHNFNIDGTTVTLTSEGGNLTGGHSAAVELNGTNTALNIHADKTFISVGNASDTGNALYLTDGSKTEFAGKDGSHGDVYIDGYVTVTDGASATFAENTTTHVDSKYLTNENKAFITTKDGDKTAGNVTFAEGSYLDIGNIDTGDTLNFSDSETVSGDAASHVLTDNVLQKFTVQDGKLVADTVSNEEAAQVLSGALLTNVALYATDNNVAGVKPLVDGDHAVEALNSAAGLSAIAGVEHGTYTAAGIFNDAVAGHLMNRNDKDVWAYGFHNKENVNGLSFGANYDAQYNGVVAGADLYKSGGTVAGIALSYADGNVSGSNGFATTRNDADYYGASLYARFDRGSYALLGDISYMKGDHDVEQWNKGQQITASPDSDAVSVGVKAVKDFTAGESGTLTPYIGVRYLRLSTDGFTASNGLHYDGDDQDLVLIPVGVNYSAAITGGSWTFRPYAGVGYIWNAGDKSTDQTVSLGTASDSFSYDTVDSGSFLTRVGFVADHGDMSYGVGYSWQKGDSVSNNAWTLSASFRF